MNHVVTRFAPSPTGYLHIGGIRTALINYIVVQQAKLKNKNSKFLLRIEDTDKIRSKKEYKESILNGLKWLKLNWDEKVFIQSDRANNHINVAYELLKKNLAFKCICTTEELEKKRIQKLWQEFKSLEAIKDASINELKEKTSFSEKLCKEIQKCSSMD